MKIGPMALNILVPSLPKLAATFATDTGTVQLTVSLYLVGFASAQLVIGPLSDRFPPAILGGIGLAILCVGLALIATLPAEPNIFGIVWRMMICGAGFGFFQSPNLRAIMSSAPPERSGGASGIVATSRLVGQAIGAALVALCFGISMAQVSLYTMMAAGPVIYMLNAVAPQLREAAMTLKAPPLVVFWRIVFPLTLPGVVIGQVLVFLNVMADFATVATVGGNKHAMLPNLVLLFYEGSQHRAASVVAVLLMACMLIGVIAAMKVVDIRRLGADR